jgi:tRNA U34 2-thiouridine synthase MnmA/TrmU
MDCTKGKLFQEYIDVIKKHEHGYGSGMNPCIDCRIFMLKKTKQLISKYKAKFIVTGEVLNERPMSQTKHKMELIEKETGLKGKILRPLSAKVMEETESEKKKWVKREKLLDIQGRERKVQMALAKKYKISYPTPAGGCLLCEKEFAIKLRDLFKYKKVIEPRDISLLRVGRHFKFGDKKIIVGRNEAENKILMKMAKNDLILEVKDYPGPTTLLEKTIDKKIINKAAQLTLSHSDVKNKKNIIVVYGKRKLNKSLKISPLSQKELENLRIKNVKS